ncbi:MAG TPA: ABC transporter ATP-binding protein [Gammaproteobacteria bacterium]|nr:ABC transporter ATP-binding protein [Gammaproteobacteria bacterium]
MSSIEFDHISKSYSETRVLDDVSLTLSSSQTTAIVGESGSGKSTLLQIVNGLVVADEGVVKIADAEIDYDALPKIRRNMGYAVQGAGLFPHLTIRENVTLVAQLAGWGHAQLEERYANLLSLFGLDDELSGRYPHSLSGGQQQRIGLCRAMMLDPPLLLLDEPFSALDPITRESIHEEMLQLIDGKKSILLVTHDMQEALKLAGYLVILKSGKVIQQGAPEDVANHPVDDYVARFFGSANA